MKLTRRDFLKWSGVVAGGAVAGSSLVSSSTVLAAAPKQFLLKKRVKETSTICCYCSVGCGAIVSSYEDGIVKIEGNPDHPINEGSLCPKGLAMSQIHQVDGKPNPLRLTKPLYRAPNSGKWEQKSWDWVIENIAKRVKSTRDSNWNAKSARVDAIAGLGGGELDNEECYLLTKMNRALGLMYQEHCARL